MAQHRETDDSAAFSILVAFPASRSKETRQLAATFLKGQRVLHMQQLNCPLVAGFLGCIAAELRSGLS
jgi:hypothetical protein